MESYEIRFFGPQGPVCCLAMHASDHNALRSAQNLLDKYRPAAAVWQGARLVGEVRRVAPPALARKLMRADGDRHGINIG
jgi:hypothetical protein